MEFDDFYARVVPPKWSKVPFRSMARAEPRVQHAPGTGTGSRNVDVPSYRHTDIFGI